MQQQNKGFDLNIVSKYQFNHHATQLLDILLIIIIIIITVLVFYSLRIFKLEHFII